ncbi:MAG: heterodisulfide reductase subunit B [Firmicutes bacterium]|nr:heterodisulfide reductase subunit B [Bacillota bacterium]
MKYSYYPGCCHHTSAKEYDISSRVVCDTLGIQLTDVPDWSCCGSTAAHSTSHLLATSLAARNLSLAEKEGEDVVASCAACYQRLAMADHHLKTNKDLLQEVNQILDRPYGSSIKVRSMLDVIYSAKSTLAAGVKKPLQGLKVAAYYGCLLVRPLSVRVDDAEYPQTMDELLETAGAQAVEWGFKTECCGASLAISNEDIVLELVFKILEAARDAGANCIVTACPLCHFNLDVRQEKLNKSRGKSFNLPVFYFTQLIGLSLGIDQRDLSLGTHFLDPSRLIKTFDSFNGGDRV